MALTVETGEGLAEADSLVTLAEARAFAQSRGKSLPNDDTACEALLRNAHDYLGEYEDRLQGVRSAEGQGLPFPRNGVSLYGVLQADSLVPSQAKNAVCQLALEAMDRDLQLTSDGRVATTETVGVITTVYKVQGLQPQFPKVEAFLRPLLINGSSILRTVRV